MNNNDYELELEVMKESIAHHREFGKHMITVNVTFLSFVLIITSLIYTIASRDASLTIMTLASTLVAIIFPLGMLVYSLGNFIRLYMPPTMALSLDQAKKIEYYPEHYKRIIKIKNRAFVSFITGVISTITYLITILGIIVGFYL